MMERKKHIENLIEKITQMGIEQFMNKIRVVLCETDKIYQTDKSDLEELKIDENTVKINY